MVAKHDAKGATGKGGKAAKGGRGKKSGKKSVSHRSAMLLDGIPVSEMSREQLLSHLTRLLDQLEKEREERNFFQLERDQLYGFWKVAKDEVEDIRARLRNKEKELDDAEDLRQRDIAVYKQQIKCTLHEHQTTLNETRAEHQQHLELAHFSHQEQEREMRQEQQKLKEELRQLTLNQQLNIDILKLEHSQQMSNLKMSLEQESRQLEVKFQNKMEAQRNELEKRRRNDLQEIDVKDQQHVGVLKTNHEQALIDLKNYFNDIVLNNMTLITSMKEQMAEFRIKEERTEKQLLAASKELKHLREKSDLLERRNIELQKETESWQQAKSALDTAKGRQKHLSKQLEEVTWQREVAEQQLARVKNERNELEERFMVAILEVQQKANLKQLVLEKKLDALKDAVKSKDIALKNFTTNSTGSQNNVGTFSSGAETGSSARERRKQTIVKMNFESENHLEEDETTRHDKSFLSSSSSTSNAVEEKLSVHSESLTSNVLLPPTKIKSSPAIDSLDQIEKVVGQRKHLSAH